MSDQHEEWFRGTSGSVWAVLAAVVCVVIVVLDIADDWHPVVTVGAVLFGLVCYAAFLRPRVGVRGDTFVLDGMYSSQSMPLAALESVAVGRTLGAYAGGRTFVSGAVGRSLRTMVRPGKRERSSEGDYADFVEQRLTSLAREARALAGIKDDSDEQYALARQVRRTWDWLLIGATVVVVVVFVVLLLVG